MDKRVLASIGCVHRDCGKDEEYLRDEEEKNQNTACGASCWRSGSLYPNASQVFG